MGKEHGSSQLLHGSTAAFRTASQIYVPYCFEQFCHGETCIALAESLAPLEPEDQFQISGLHPVIEESIIADLLETGGEHMQQETPDKLFVAESDLPFRITGFPSPGRKNNLCFHDGKNPAVGNCNLVGIAPQILNRVAKAVEGLLDIRAPFLSIKEVVELLPDAIHLQFPTRRKQKPGSRFCKASSPARNFPLNLSRRTLTGRKTFWNTSGSYGQQ